MQKNGAAIITDDSGTQISELRAFDLRKAIGKRTTITGTIDATATPAGGASQVIKVSKATLSPKGASCSALAAKLGASTAAAGLAAGVGAGAAGAAGAGAAAAGGAAAAAAGIGTTAAVVAGVGAAGAAAVGGAAAAGAFSTPSP